MGEFYIKQGATQPILVMKVTNDNEFSYEKFHEALENSTITFSMINIETGTYKITKKRGGIILADTTNPTTIEEEQYYIYYKFTSKDTDTPGRYRGEFKIEFYDTQETDQTGTFIAPLHEDLFITVKDSLFM